MKFCSYPPSCWFVAEIHGSYVGYAETHQGARSGSDHARNVEGDDESGHN